MAIVAHFTFPDLVIRPLNTESEATVMIQTLLL